MDCELCYETFNKDDHVPKVLQYCGHTFCQRCLANLVNSKGKLQCPLCRYEIASHSAQPPTNFALLQLIEQLECEREGKGLSRFFKPKQPPFGCVRWEELSEYVKRDHDPKFLKLRLVQEGGETVFTECTKGEFDKYILSRLEL